jgi:hypothetical protein
VPTNTAEMLEAVLPRPDLSLASHFCRSAGTASASGIAIGVTSARPINVLLGPGVAGDGTVAWEVTVGAIAGAGGGGGFFLKKLNIWSLL